MNRLDEIVASIEQCNSPPVHLWHPERHGEIDIVINAQGQWFHEGGEIKRKELVNLFASILWAEDEDYFLVTPAEKLKIVVHDVPFVIQQMELVDEHWVATTNTSEQLLVGEQHPVAVRRYQQQPVPYIRVRYDLWARLSRAVYYQWMTDALEAGDTENPTLTSGKYQIRLGESG